MAWKDLNDHCGEFGSDKDFFINWNIGIDGCCQVSSNPYYTSSTNSWGIIIQIGQNTPNNYIKWGTDFIFDNHLDTNIPNDARLYTVPEISGQCVGGSRRVRFNHKIKAIMKIFYNYKYQSIPSLELYYRDEDYPSRPDRYPWNFMFIFAREDSKCYYQTYDSGKEKINYLGRVDLTGFLDVDAFSTWNGGSYNGRLVTYGNKMRMNWYTKNMYSSSTGVGLRYYLKQAMKDNQYSGNKFISGGGGCRGRRGPG